MFYGTKAFFGMKTLLYGSKSFHGMKPFSGTKPFSGISGGLASYMLGSYRIAGNFREGKFS